MKPDQTVPLCHNQSLPLFYSCYHKPNITAEHSFLFCDYNAFCAKTLFKWVHFASPKPWQKHRSLVTGRQGDIPSAWTQLRFLDWLVVTLVIFFVYADFQFDPLSRPKTDDVGVRCV